MAVVAGSGVRKHPEKPQAVSWQIWCLLQRRGRWIKRKCSLGHPGKPIASWQGLCRRALGRPHHEPVTVSGHKGMGLHICTRIGPPHSLARGPSCSAFFTPPCTKPTLALVFARCLWKKSTCREGPSSQASQASAPLRADAGVCLLGGFGGPELHTGRAALRSFWFMVLPVPAPICDVSAG